MRGVRANAAIEFALTLPVLLGLTGGIVDYGFVFDQMFDVEAACRDAARAGAVTPILDGPAKVAEGVARALLTENGLDGTGASVTAITDGSAPNQMLVVTVSVAPFLPFGLAPAPAALSATVAMRLDEQT